MIKHIFLILLLSVAMVMAMPYAQQLVGYLITAHDWISDILKDVFTGGQAGNILRELIALLSIPFIVALIPAVIYWIARRRWLPGFMEIMWVVWLVQAGALAISYKAGTALAATAVVTGG